MLALPREAVDEFGQTVVMVTHDPEAATQADGVLFLADGRIADVLDRPIELGDNGLPSLRTLMDAHGCRIDLVAVIPQADMRSTSFASRKSGERVVAVTWCGGKTVVDSVRRPYAEVHESPASSAEERASAI